MLWCLAIKQKFQGQQDTAVCMLLPKVQTTQVKQISKSREGLKPLAALNSEKMMVCPSPSQGPIQLQKTIFTCYFINGGSEFNQIFYDQWPRHCVKGGRTLPHAIFIYTHPRFLNCKICVMDSLQIISHNAYWVAFFCNIKLFFPKTFFDTQSMGELKHTSLSNN